MIGNSTALFRAGAIGAMLLIALGCGGPYLNGNLVAPTISHETEIDSLTVSLLRAGGAKASAKLPINKPTESQPFGFEYSRQQLEQAFGGVKIQRNTDALLVGFEKYAQKYIIVYKDSGDREITLEEIENDDIPELSCDKLFRAHPELESRTGVKFGMKYLRIYTNSIEIPVKDMKSKAKQLKGLRVESTPVRQPLNCKKESAPHPWKP